MLRTLILATSLLALALLVSVPAAGAPDIEESKLARVIRLQKSEYPGQGQSKPSEALIQAFVRQRVKLAQKLHKNKRLNDAILVYEGLSLYVPSIIEPRFDLAKLYYERVLLLKNKSQLISTGFAGLAKAGKKEAAEAKLKELGTLHKIIVSDATKGRDELKKYLQQRPKDTRPSDILWRFYLITGEAPKSLSTLNKMLKETPQIDEVRKQRYNKIRDAIKEQMNKASSKKGR